MKNINRITNALKGEEFLLICSPELAFKLDQELFEIALKGLDNVRLFPNLNSIDLGVNSVYYNGTTLHYTGDLDRFMESIKNN